MMTMSEFQAAFAEAMSAVTSREPGARAKLAQLLSTGTPEQLEAVGVETGGEDEDEDGETDHGEGADGEIEATLTREHFVHQTVVHALLCTLSELHYESDGFTWQGDRAAGLFSYNNGCGDSHALAWNKEGLVAIEFDHEHGEQPEVMDQIPDALAALGQTALESIGGDVTNCLWIQGAEHGCSEEWACVFGLESLYPYSESPEHAVFGGASPQPWLELHSLDPEHGQLALELARRLQSGTTKLEPKELALLKTPPSEADNETPEPATIDTALAKLKLLGVDAP